MKGKEHPIWDSGIKPRDLGCRNFPQGWRGGTLRQMRNSAIALLEQSDSPGEPRGEAAHAVVDYVKKLREEGKL